MHSKNCCTIGHGTGYIVSAARVLLLRLLAVAFLQPNTTLRLAVFLPLATAADTTHLMHSAICFLFYFRHRSSSTHFIRLASLLLALVLLVGFLQLLITADATVISGLFYGRAVATRAPYLSHGMDDKRRRGKGTSVRHCAPTSTKDYMIENKTKLWVATKHLLLRVVWTYFALLLVCRFVPFRCALWMQSLYI